MDDTITKLVAERQQQQTDLDARRQAAEEKYRQDAERFHNLQRAWAGAQKDLDTRPLFSLGRALVKYHLDAYLPELIDYHRAWHEKDGERNDLLFTLEILSRSCAAAAGKASMKTLGDAIKAAREVYPHGLAMPLMSIQRSLDARDEDKGPKAWFGPKPGEMNRVPPHAVPRKPDVQPARKGRKRTGKGQTQIKFHGAKVYKMNNPGATTAEVVKAVGIPRTTLTSKNRRSEWETWCITVERAHSSGRTDSLQSIIAKENDRIIAYLKVPKKSSDEDDPT
ncbi:MAG: hypothetical protein NTW96_26195 [Planctomycetia bacterium]|nr:hypothetical protein [Planctomycetia bacterium]